MDDSFDQCIWSEMFRPILIRDKKFYKIYEALLLALGIVIHVKKKGYKDLDNLLQRHGETIKISFMVLNVGISFQHNEPELYFLVLSMKDVIH